MIGVRLSKNSRSSDIAILWLFYNKTVIPDPLALAEYETVIGDSALGASLATYLTLIPRARVEYEMAHSADLAITYSYPAQVE